MWWKLLEGQLEPRGRVLALRGARGVSGKLLGCSRCHGGSRRGLSLPPSRSDQRCLGPAFPVSVPELGLSTDAGPCSFHADSRLLLPPKPSRAWGQGRGTFLLCLRMGSRKARKGSPGAPWEPWEHLQQLQWSSWRQKSPGIKSTWRQKSPGAVAGLVPTWTRGCSTERLRFPQNWRGKAPPSPRGKFSALALRV